MPKLIPYLEFIELTASHLGNIKLFILLHDLHLYVLIHFSYNQIFSYIYK